MADVMALVADRFLTVNKRCFDLATTSDIQLEIESTKEPAEQLEWLARCAASLAETTEAGGLRDYGLIGTTDRFEAWEGIRLGGMRGQRGAEMRHSSVDPCTGFDWLFDDLETTREGGLRHIQLASDERFGSPRAIHELARGLRVRGFVPVALEALLKWPALQKLLTHRSVVCFDDRRKHGSGADPALTCQLADASLEELRVVGLVEWVDAVSGSVEAARTTPIEVAHRVAEAAPAYRVMRLQGQRRRPRGPRALVDAERTTAALVRQLRVEASERLRRGDIESAGSALFELGRRLLALGDTAAASKALLQAGEAFHIGERPRGLIEAATLVTAIRIDRGELARAERALRTLRLAAARERTREMMDAARLGLGRCLFWQGRFEESRVLLIEPACTLEYEVARHRRLARCAIAVGDLMTAGVHMSEALALVGDERLDAVLAASHTDAAALQAAIGDRSALDHHVRLGLAASTRVNLPLRRLRLRIVELEGLLRCAAPEIERCAKRLQQQRPSAPPLLRARIDRVLERAGMKRGTAVAAFVRAQGATGLIASPRERGDQPMYEELMELLHVCHDGEDNPETLGRVCLLLRDKLGASGTGLYAAATTGTLAPIASAGRVPPDLRETASRAAAMADAVGPARAAARIELAVPVRYGGHPIASLACVWPGDATIDTTHVTTTVTAAAAASASCVRAALDRRIPPPHTDEDLGLIGISRVMDDLRQAILRAASAPFHVLLIGESGSGKELVASAIHRTGARRERRFCAVNCAALTDDLLEAELFGHTRGAFTGAMHERPGLFEDANGGTLFLDEISELSARGQAKLLRAIQEGEIRRIGENTARKIDVRVVAASNRPLTSEVQAGRFRHDLLYRLDVIRIVVPPLRERLEDLGVLTGRFWAEAARQTGTRATLDPQMLAALGRHNWPGNVRELQNVMAALAVRAPRRGRVKPEHLPASFELSAEYVPAKTLEQARRDFEQHFVRDALARAGGQRTRAALELGLTRQGLAKVLTRLGIG